MKFLKTLKPFFDTEARVSFGQMLVYVGQMAVVSAGLAIFHSFRSLHDFMVQSAYFLTGMTLMAIAGWMLERWLDYAVRVCGYSAIFVTIVARSPFWCAWFKLGDGRLYQCAACKRPFEAESEPQ